MRQHYIVIVRDENGRERYWNGIKPRFVTRRSLAAQFSSMANAEAVARTLKVELKVHVTVAPVTGAR